MHDIVAEVQKGIDSENQLLSQLLGQIKDAMVQVAASRTRLKQLGQISTLLGGGRKKTAPRRTKPAKSAKQSKSAKAGRKRAK